MIVAVRGSPLHGEGFKRAFRRNGSLKSWYIQKTSNVQFGPRSDPLCPDRPEGDSSDSAFKRSDRGSVSGLRLSAALPPSPLTRNNPPVLA
jgi:hypothetical protein